MSSKHSLVTLMVCGWLTEEMLQKAAVIKSELESEITKSRCETANVQDALHKMKVVSDGLSQDKIDLNKTVMQVLHYLTLCRSCSAASPCQLLTSNSKSLWLWILLYLCTHWAPFWLDLCLVKHILLRFSLTWSRLLLDLTWFSFSLSRCQTNDKRHPISLHNFCRPTMSSTTHERHIMSESAENEVANLLIYFTFIYHFINFGISYDVSIVLIMVNKANYSPFITSPTTDLSQLSISRWSIKVTGSRSRSYECS